jgi:hypothetical protein
VNTTAASFTCARPPTRHAGQEPEAGLRQPINSYRNEKTAPTDTPPAAGSLKKKRTLFSLNGRGPDGSQSDFPMCG